jgi:hypothetical protein
VPHQKVRWGYPSLKGEACLRSRTTNYSHPLLLATRAMGLNGLAGPLGIPLKNRLGDQRRGGVNGSR